MLGDIELKKMFFRLHLAQKRLPHQFLIGLVDLIQHVIEKGRRKKTNGFLKSRAVKTSTC